MAKAKDLKTALFNNKPLLIVLIIAIALGIIGAISTQINNNQIDQVNLKDSNEVVQSFYDWYMDYVKENHVFTDRGYQDSVYLAPEAIERLDSTIDSFGTGGGYDPIFCGQRPPNAYRIEVDSDNDNTFLVLKDYGGQELSHSVTVVQEKGLWRISNIICEQF